MTRNWTIYMYTFPNGKRYVGATRRPLYYRQGSKESSWAKYKYCRLLWEAIQEFGVDNIETTILFQGEISDEEAAEMEKHYIALYKTNAKRYNNPTYGYNLGDGGEGLNEKHLTEERRAELAEQIRELGRINHARPVSEETRRRQSLAKLGKPGHKLSEETKRKIGLANSLAMISEEERRHRSDGQKEPVIAFNSVTHEKLYFDSGMQAAEYFGVAGSMISRWIKGTRTPHNGFVFEKAKKRIAV